MGEKLLTVDEAAAMLGRTPHAIYRLVERKRLPHRKYGRRLVFIESELVTFIADLPGMSLEDVRKRENVGV
jgi:excisionase family DNA binding protein